MTELLNTLYVQTAGTSLHLDGDTVRVHHPDQTGRRILPLARIDHVVLFGGVTITGDLLLRCADDRRTVSWLTEYGRFRARVDGPTAGNPLLRRAQYDAHQDVSRRLPIAQRMVAGKIHNCRQLLLRAARDADGKDRTSLRTTAERHAQSLIAARQAADLDTPSGYRGHNGPGLLRHVPPRVEASRGAVIRTRRPPTDPLNCLLSFLYGMLRVAVHGALEQVGLDPYIGYIHGVRPGKPALALDLMEEFRPLLADRLALTMLNRKELHDNDFENLPGGAVRLTDTGRRAVLNALQNNRDRMWPHAQLGREVPAALLPLVQARLLARHLRGDLDQYLPWTAT